VVELVTDQTLLTSAPYTQGLPFSMRNTTAVGPRPHRSLPRRSLLFVGACRIGPAPQIQPVAVLGETNALNCRSPRPVVLLCPGVNPG